VTGVYVVSDDAIEFRYLRTGTPSADGSVPVLAGLSAGERIAADPIAAAIAYKARPAARAGGGA
jgi:multidrug efflux pump subunit AcrA (membrane-fusion protein)